MRHLRLRMNSNKPSNLDTSRDSDPSGNETLAQVHTPTLNRQSESGQAISHNSSYQNIPGTYSDNANFSRALNQRLNQSLSNSSNPGELSRRNSETSIVSVPHTPINQMPPPNVGFTMHRLGSISSICTTDEEDFNETQWKWLPEHDNLLMTQFSKYQDDPTTAPFSGRFPPSGVTQRVAKNTLEAAGRANVQFPHSMTAIRHRLLQLVNEESQHGQPGQDTQHIKGQILPTTSMVTPPTRYVDYFNTDLSGPVQLQSYNSNNAASQPEPSQDSMDFDFTESRKADSNSYNEADERMDEFDETPKPNRFSKCSLGSNRLPPPPLNLGGLQASDSIPLSSPFVTPKKEQRSAQFGMEMDFDDAIDSDEDDNSVPNIVARRKRDSLRMKRGLR